jgi:hypothetical protein
MDDKLIKELRELERILDRRFAEVMEKIHEVSERVSVDIATLKTKAAFAGFVAGVLPGIVALIFDLTKHK